MALCQFSQTFQDLSGVVDIGPRFIVGDAIVRQGILRTIGIRVAVKAGRFSNDSRSDELVVREIHAISQLQHENIIELLGYTIENSKIMMVTPWMELGNAHEYVQNEEVDPRPLLRGIANGLCYLHSQNIFHGDLQGKNVLISEDCLPKIIDFSNTSHPQFNGIHRSSGGSTLQWMAPEAIEQEGLATAEGDVWSFGMVVLELFTRKKPFEDIPGIRGVQIRIIHGHPPERPHGQTTHFRMSENWWNTCCACWNYEAHIRPTMTNVLENITWGETAIGIGHGEDIESR